MDALVQRIADANGLQHAFEIRRRVFVDEQEVAPALEYDEFEDTSVHYLAWYGGLPVGTARWRYIGDKIKLERFAVLKEFRGKSIGAALVSTLLKDTLALKPKKIYLHAQVQVIPFYEKFGFEAVGGVFEEAGILHRVMYYLR